MERAIQNGIARNAVRLINVIAESIELNYWVDSVIYYFDLTTLVLIMKMDNNAYTSVFNCYIFFIVTASY